MTPDRAFRHGRVGPNDFAGDAVDRAIAVSQQAGVPALRVHALHERAKQFHEHDGFLSSPANPMTLNAIDSMRARLNVSLRT